MHTRKVSRTLTARDGTRITWHTHVPIGNDAPDEAALARRPTLLLTNGIGTSENFWKHLVHVFSRDHRVVHWDYRGHGDSAVSSDGDYSMRTQADDLARVTEAVMATGDRSTPPVHIGFSMGVIVLLELYRARRDLVTGMVLVGGPPDAPYSTVLPFKLPGVMPVLVGAMRALKPLVRTTAPAVNALFNAPFAYSVGRTLGLLRKRAPRDEIETFMESFTRMDPRAFWDTLCELMSARASDVLPSVTVPTLLIAASHDLMVPRAQIERLATGLRGPHRTLIEDSGHAVLLEAGPEVAAAIRLFLRGLEPQGP